MTLVLTHATVLSGYDRAGCFQRARGGDRSAQAELVRTLQDRWYRMCLAMLGDADMARDASQETALRFLRSLRRYRGDSALSTWSLGIAVNVCREHRRKAKRALRLVEPAEPRRPDAIVAEAEQFDRVRDLVADLPDRQREAIVLRYFEQLTVEQTAKTMRCAVGTVKATLNHAMRNLRQRWENA